MKKILMIVGLVTGALFLSIDAMDSARLNKDFLKPRDGEQWGLGVHEASVAAMIEEYVVTSDVEDEVFEAFLERLREYLKENTIYLLERGCYRGVSHRPYTLLAFCEVHLDDVIGTDHKKRRRLFDAVRILRDLGASGNRPEVTSALAQPAIGSARPHGPHVNRTTDSGNPADKKRPGSSVGKPRSKKFYYLGLATGMALGCLYFFWKRSTKNEKKA